MSFRIFSKKFNIIQFLFIYKIVFVMAIFLINDHSFADKRKVSLKSCLNIFKSKTSLKSKIDLILTPERALEIFEQLKSDALNIFNTEVNTDVNAKLSELYERYLEIRLSYLSPEQAEEVMGVVNNLSYSVVADEMPSKENNKVIYYLDGNSAINISIPKSYTLSIADFYLRVHESEHIIQHIIMGKLTYKKELKYYYFYLHSEEKGAMLAEAIFSLAIPQEYTESLLQDIESNKNLHYDFKNFFVSILTQMLVRTDPLDYVKNQWTNGRYSKKQMLEMYLENKILKKQFFVYLTLILIVHHTDSWNILHSVFIN